MYIQRRSARSDSRDDCDVHLQGECSHTDGRDQPSTIKRRKMTRRIKPFSYHYYYSLDSSHSVIHDLLSGCDWLNDTGFYARDRGLVEKLHQPIASKLYIAAGRVFSICISLDLRRIDHVLQLPESG